MAYVRSTELFNYQHSLGEFWFIGTAKISIKVAQNGEILLALLTLMLLVGNFGLYKMIQTAWKMTETLAYGYSSESTQRDRSN